MLPVDEHSIDFLKENISGIKGEIKAIHAELKNKVSFKTFTWVLSLLMLVTIGILGIIYQKVDKTEDKVDRIGSDSVLIKYRLDNPVVK